MLVFSGRQCHVSELSLEEAQAFVEEHHRQGAVKTHVKITSLGLWQGETLLMVAQFCSPRTPRKYREYTVELLRLCSKTEVRVRGGASKLLQAYRRKYQPWDIFTYQDSTGENGAVYEHCGFHLVSQEAAKEYLVAPGKTLATASRKEALATAYAVRYGPDRILGTKLGEVYDAQGKRKSNRRLFLEELGWHSEATSGDKVYAWFNPAYSHYTYKITAADSDKYYYGVASLKKQDATEEDCLQDGYWGSGKNKYQHWKEKHANALVKTIMGIHGSRGEALAAEKKLVGESYRHDPLCLNAMPGGVHRLPIAFEKLITVKLCPVHGETKFMGNTCQKCTARKTFTVKLCPVHGETPFMGKRCQKCIMEARTEEATCPRHGTTVHQSGRCLKCEAAKTVRQLSCPVHGLTTHHGSRCAKCQLEAMDCLKECKNHGLTPHRGDSCFKCSQERAVSLKLCPVHGESKHLGDKCYKCRRRAVSQEECPEHGVTKFEKGKCLKCRSKAMTTKGHCPVHGESTFQWGKCCRCRPSAKRKK